MDPEIWGFLALLRVRGEGRLSRWRIAHHGSRIFRGLLKSYANIGATVRAIIAAQGASIAAPF